MKRIFLIKTLLITTCFLGLTKADVYIDNMKSGSNKSTTGGIIFVVEDTAGGSIWNTPKPKAFNYFDLANGGPAEGSGIVTYLDGEVGGAGEYPHLTYGMYMEPTKLVIHDLSQQFGFAIRVRGKGKWRTKVKCKIIDSIAIADLGKEEDQVAWRYSFTNLDSMEFKWYVIPVDSLSSNIAEMNNRLTELNISKREVLKSAWKYYVQTDGYVKAQAGEKVWIQISDIILLGSMTKLGNSTVGPSPAQCAEFGACFGSNSIRSAHVSLTAKAPSANSKVFSLNGHFVGTYGSLRESANLPRMFLINDNALPSLHSSMTGK